jgi:hypothetical protein
VGLAVARDEPELLRTASIDVLHEPYREVLVPGLRAARDGAAGGGAHAAFLSGAGPTVGAVVSEATEAACRGVLADFAGPAGPRAGSASAGGYEVEGAAPARGRAAADGDRRPHARAPDGEGPFAGRRDVGVRAQAANSRS